MKTGQGVPVTKTGDGVFIHISEGYNDAHKALMSLKMAAIMADDKDVLIYMDIHAVNLLVKGSENLTHDELNRGILSKVFRLPKKINSLTSQRGG